MVKIFAKVAGLRYIKYIENVSDVTGSNNTKAVKKPGRYRFNINTYIRMNKML